jgi:hypothetical protein
MVEVPYRYANLLWTVRVLAPVYAQAVYFSSLFLQFFLIYLFIYLFILYIDLMRSIDAG